MLSLVYLKKILYEWQLNLYKIKQIYTQYIYIKMNKSKKIKQKLMKS